MISYAFRAVPEAVNTIYKKRDILTIVVAKPINMKLKTDKGKNGPQASVSNRKTWK
jgi:RNase H-fold protein (predicted Holliday junction resolvase)